MYPWEALIAVGYCSAYLVPADFCITRSAGHLANREIGEEHLSLLLALGDEVAEEQEEVGQSPGLKDVEPGLQVDAGGREAHR